MYALSVREVIDYLGVSENGDFTDTDIWQMFWNDNNSHSEQKLWIRSANDTGGATVLVVRGDNGSFYYYYNYDSYRVRPAFQIDLSKVEWTA